MSPWIKPYVQEESNCAVRSMFLNQKSYAVKIIFHWHLVCFVINSSPNCQYSDAGIGQNIDVV